MNERISVAKNELEIIFDYSGCLMFAIDYDKRIVRVNGVSENWGLGSPSSLLQKSLLDVLEQCHDTSGTDLAIHFDRAWEEMVACGTSGFPIVQTGICPEDASSYLRLQKVHIADSRDGLAPRLFAICCLHTREDMLANGTIIDEHLKRWHRRRLAMDIHDGPLQDLVAARFSLEIANCVGIGDSGRSGVATSLPDVIHLIEHAIEHLREVCQEDSAIIANEFSLETEVLRFFDSLSELAGSTKLSFSMDVPMAELPSPFAKDLLFIIREGVFNALKSSFSERVNVALSAANDQLSLSIADDGIGFDVETSLGSREGLGLTIMHERAHAMGGMIEVISTPGNGCTILGRWGLLRQAS